MWDVHYWTLTSMFYACFTYYIKGRYHLISKMEILLKLFTSQFELSLCPMCNRPNQIEWRNFENTINRWESRIGLVKLCVKVAVGSIKTDNDKVTKRFALIVWNLANRYLVKFDGYPLFYSQKTLEILRICWFSQ